MCFAKSQLFTALLAVCVGLGALGPARAADVPEDALVEPGRFTYAASGEFRPFSYVDARQRLAGFDIDVGNAIARQLGLAPSPRKYKFAAIVEGVKTGRFDAAVASHTITPARLATIASLAAALLALRRASLRSAASICLALTFKSPPSRLIFFSPLIR